MATFFFDGSQNLTLDSFDVDNDQIVFELEASEVASVSNVNGSATLTTTSGATLVFSGLTFAALAEATILPETFFIIGDDDDNLTLTADADGSVIVANDGDDVLAGDTGADLLLGNMGDDVIDGNGGSDRIYGGMGDDVINVDGAESEEAEDDVVFIAGGQDSDDINVVNFEGAITVYGGDTGVDASDDDDTIDVELADDATALITGNGGDDVITITADGGATNGGDVTVYGGQGDDVIGATVNGGVFFGNIGEDAITVSAQEDITVYGGQDDDDITVTVAGGNSVLLGNLGDDDITFTGAGDFTVYGGAGDDAIDTNADLTGDAVIYAGLGEDVVDVGTDENISVYGGNGIAGAEDGDDTITVTLGGTDQEVYIEGNLGADTITVDGNAGQITILGGEGDDIIDGGTLSDDSVIYGGAGEDEISAVVAGDASIFGGIGLGDTVDGGDNIDLNVTVAGAEVSVYGLGGDDTITLQGEGEVSVFGGTGDDVIDFAQTGGADATGLYTLTGGEGEDTFDFTNADILVAGATEDNVNSITDLAFGTDTVDFGVTITATADLTDLSGTAATDFDTAIEAANGDLAVAAEAAFDFAVANGSIAATTQTAVVFDFEGESYLIYGQNDAAVGAEVDGIVKITGYTGELDNGDFATA